MIDGCECIDCVCDRNTRMKDSVLICYDCRRGRHRRNKREADPPRVETDHDKMARIAALIEERQRAGAGG